MLGRGGPNEYPIALNGRTPIKVNGEGGAIEIGDRITISSAAGIGKKAVGAGEVIGVAMERFDGNGDGAIVSFVLPQWWDGKSSSSVTAQTAAPTIDTNSVLAVKDNRIANIASMNGYKWSVDENGDFVTEGAYAVKIKSHQGENVNANAILGRQHLIMLAGTAKLEGGSAIVEFENIDPQFNDIISSVRPIIVVATMSNGSGNVSVTSKSMNGFTLVSGGDGNGTEADWVVYAYRKDYEPEEKREGEEEKRENEEEENQGINESVDTESTEEEKTIEEEAVLIEDIVPVAPSSDTPAEAPTASSAEPETTSVETMPAESLPTVEVPATADTTVVTTETPPSSVPETIVTTETPPSSVPETTSTP